MGLFVIYFQLTWISLICFQFFISSCSCPWLCPAPSHCSFAFATAYLHCAHPINLIHDCWLDKIGSNIYPQSTKPHQPHQEGGEPWRKQPAARQPVDRVTPPKDRLWSVTWRKFNQMFMKSKSGWGLQKVICERYGYHPQVWFECPSVSRAAEAKVAGVGNGVAGITDSVNPVTTCPGSILKDSIHIHSMRML